MNKLIDMLISDQSIPEQALINLTNGAAFGGYACRKTLIFRRFSQ